MNEYISVGKKVLKELINNGFEAFFVGEAVRNSILKREIIRVDITTSANKYSVKKVFEDYIYEDIDETMVRLEYLNYNFYIQSFMVHESPDKNVSTVKHYSRNLLDDLSNRDFTINAIAMSHSGKLTDAHDGYNDTIKKRITHIGNAKVRFSQNPTLIIKAFALISELNFKLSRKTMKAINKRRKYLLKCNVEDYALELKKVFDGPYAKNAIIMMNKTNIDMVLPLFKKVIRKLGSKYKKVNFEEVLLMCFILSGKIDRRYDDYIEDIGVFTKIYDVAMNFKTPDYDTLTLFYNGLDICLEANYVNYLLGKCSRREKKIKKLWNNLIIKSIDDLEYNSENIKAIIFEEDYNRIDEIMEEIILAILNKDLLNSYNQIESRVLKILRNRGIEFDLNKNEKSVAEDNEEAIENDIVGDLENQILDEQNKLIQEDTDLRTQEIDELTAKSIDFINDNEQLKNIIKDNEDFKEQLHKFIADYIKDEEDS